MTTQQEAVRNFLSVLVDVTREDEKRDVDDENTNLYEVGLVTGTAIEGTLSPFDDQSDYIRVKPTKTDEMQKEFRYTIALRHVVYIRQKPLEYIGGSNQTKRSSAEVLATLKPDPDPR